MRIHCPVCKAETPVSGLISFKCTSCGRRFSRPVPKSAKDAPIFIMSGALAALAGAFSKGSSMGLLKELAPFIVLFGAGAFVTGVAERFFADKSNLVVQEEEKGRVVGEYPVVDLDR